MRSQMTPADVIAVWEWADDHEDVYAGLRYERQDSSSVVIDLFTSADPVVVAEQVQPLLSDRATLRVVRRELSKADLQAIAERICDEFAPPPGAPPVVVSTFTDLDRQAVGVGLYRDDPELRAALLTRFGDRIYIDTVSMRAVLPGDLEQ